MPAETLHSTPQGSTPEERRLAKAQAELERATFDYDQKEAFGKFDVTAPNEGTYQSYLDQRPAEGVVRDNDGYRTAQNGQFAGEQAYEAQKGDTQAYYDQLGGLVNEGEYQVPDYEAMGVMQLAKEAAKAQRIGDIAEEATIREALEQHLTIDALKNDAETPEAAQKRYEAEVARYEDLVEKFSGKSDAVSSVTATPEVSSKPAEQEPAPTEKEVTEPEISLNGEKVTIDNVFESPDGQKAVLVKGADGAVRLVLEKELTYTTQEAAPEEEVEDEPTIEDSGQPKESEASEEPEELEVSEAPEAEDEPVQLSTSKELERFVGKELEPYDASRHALEKLEVEKEQTKKWWQKASEAVRKRAGTAYWSAQWETYVKTPVREKWSKWLEYGVTDDMTGDEKEKRRKDNRVIAIAAGAGLAVVGAAVTGVLIANGLATMDNAPETGGLGKGVGRGGFDTLKDTGLDVGEGTQNALFTPEAELPPITVQSGDGGEALFTRYGIPTEKWYDNAQTLLTQFPQDFYQEGNDVRIAHTGPLSQGAQDFINALK